MSYPIYSGAVLGRAGVMSWSSSTERVVNFLSASLMCALLALTMFCPVLAQVSSLPSGKDSAASAELSSHDEAATFKVKVNLVLVRVVVRDSEGRAIGNLKREDFQLFDNRKPQVIQNFAVEQPGTEVQREEKASQGMSGTEGGRAPAVPERYLAFVFDDIHLNGSNVIEVRTATDKYLASLQPTDRAAIYTTSGQTTLEFTDDRPKLHETLFELNSRPIAGSGFKECPDISYYMADLIQNKRDPEALQTATLDALACAFGNDQRLISAAQAMAMGVAARELEQGNHETQITLGILKNVIRRMSLLPGQRTVILVSPGFYNPEQRKEESEIIEGALRMNVMLSALDARGLYADPALGDISQPGPPSINAAPFEAQYRMTSASTDADVLAEFADGTGGSFFHNNNDLEAALRQLATAPEFYYLLGFSPQNLKLDGGYHSLNVTLKVPQKLSVQARRGYYAPKKIPDASEQAKQEIEEALFSQEEVHDLPVDLHTQFFKTAESDAKLAVLAHLDVRRMHFRKVEGRNGNELTVVSGLFDRNGHFVAAYEKILTMRLRDETLEKRLQSGVTMKSSFDVKPGSYLVRLVVRDAEGQISAENGAIEIP